MTTLILKDLSRFDELDHAASQSVRGGIAWLTRESPVACPGGMMPPVYIRRGWSEYPPVHAGCGPTIVPLGNSPSQPLHVVPL
ncbi:conserved hypothetical protein [Paraburkholderia ribeironis]|uniref:Uncharacterized protein n=1 Tax=Paraburkholderia ribeironis TaxID=1247936 RepID=A0A1N7SH08_9BURK|nr:hypothetical protein [Paraburkholderia ribeironis]SIT46269.1 conserved hypothetical protein [Paraburkholderia ribeironis]